MVTGYPDCVAEEFFKGETLVLYTAHTGYTTVRVNDVRGLSGLNATFPTRKDAVQFVKDAACGLPWQYNKRTNEVNNKTLTLVRLCFMDGWATMNTDAEGF